VKKIEDEEVDEISEPEDPMMLSRDAKDWKVYMISDRTPST
jgi:DnaJ family protein C protein 2